MPHLQLHSSLAQPRNKPITMHASRVRLETSRRRHAALKRKLEGEFGALDSLEARVGELEGLRKSEEARLKALQVGTLQSSNAIYRCLSSWRNVEGDSSRCGGWSAAWQTCLPTCADRCCHWL